MPPNDISSHGNEWHLDIPNHSRSLAEIPGLQSRLHDTLDRAAEQAGSDIAQWQATHGERMTAALTRTQEVAQELKKVNRDAFRLDRAYSFLKQEEQQNMKRAVRDGNYLNTTDYFNRMTIVHQALQERTSRLNIDAHEALQDLRSTLAHADHVIADAHTRLSEALQTDQPGTRPDALSPEPLAAQLATLREEIQAMRAQLGPIDPPARERPADLPLRGPGDLDPDPFTIPYRELEECSALFLLRDQEPGNPVVQQRITLVQDALNSPQIEGQTLFAKIRHLALQQEAYGKKGYDPLQLQAYENQDEGNMDKNSLTWRQLSRRIEHLDFALHASDEQTSNPPATFFNWRNNPS